MEFKELYSCESKKGNIARILQDNMQRLWLDFNDGDDIIAPNQRKDFINRAKRYQSKAYAHPQIQALIKGSILEDFEIISMLDNYIIEMKKAKLKPKLTHCPNCGHCLK